MTANERPSLRVHAENDGWGDRYGSHWVDSEVLSAAANACQMAGWVVRHDAPADAELIPYRSPETDDGIELRIAGNLIDLPFDWEPGRYSLGDASTSYLASMLVLHNPRGANTAQEDSLKVQALHSDPAIDKPHIQAQLVQVQRFSTELLASLHRQPQDVLTLPAGDFEELVAELLSHQGFSLWRTPRTRDGGFDLVALRRESIGSQLILVECKRYSPDRPVTVEPVRQLYGLVRAHGATSGLLVTTSRFTRDAFAFQRAVEYQLALRELADIQRWLTTMIKR